MALPNGDVAVNDDYRDRVVVIDPRTNRIVWKYGHTDKAGTAFEHLRIPDGMDFIPLTSTRRSRLRGGGAPVSGARDTSRARPARREARRRAVRRRRAAAISVLVACAALVALILVGGGSSLAPRPRAPRTRPSCDCRPALRRLGVAGGVSRRRVQDAAGAGDPASAGSC